jgi:hypothetical protein
MDGWIDGWTDGWMDGRMDGWMDGWMDRQTDRRTDREAHRLSVQQNLLTQITNLCYAALILWYCYIIAISCPRKIDTNDLFQAWPHQLLLTHARLNN